jgi:hypothetical protein
MLEALHFVVTHQAILRAGLGSGIDPVHLVAIHQPRSDKVSLIAKDLGWPYECPNENTEDER